jgi:hypothetical protein
MSCQKFTFHARRWELSRGENETRSDALVSSLLGHDSLASLRFGSGVLMEQIKESVTHVLRTRVSHSNPPTFTSPLRAFSLYDSSTIESLPRAISLRKELKNKTKQQTSCIQSRLILTTLTFPPSSLHSHYI